MKHDVEIYAYCKFSYFALLKHLEVFSLCMQDSNSLQKLKENVLIVMLQIMTSAVRRRVTQVAASVRDARLGSQLGGGSGRC